MPLWMDRNLVGRCLGAAVLAWPLLAGTARAQEAPPGSSWVLSLDAQQTYETNVQYRRLDGEDDFLTRAGATLGRHFLLRRSRLDLELGAGALVYRTHPELNILTWSAAAQGSQQLTRRAAVQAGLRSSQGYARDSVVLDQAVVSPFALTRTDSGAVSVRYHVTRGLEGRLEAEGDHVDFSQPGLVNGWSVVARARLDQIGDRERPSRWGAATEYERTANGGQDYEIERLFGVWRGGLARGVAARLEVGLAGFRLRDPNPSFSLDYHLTPMAAAELAGQFGRHTLAARLAREVDQTYGLGAVGVSYHSRLAYGLRIGPRLELSAGGDYARLTAGTLPVSSPTQAARILAGMRHDLEDGWSLQADYSYWHWRDSLSGWGGHTFGLAVRRRLDWR